MIKPVLEINQEEMLKKYIDVNQNSKESIIPKIEDLHPKNNFIKNKYQGRNPYVKL